MVKDRNIPYPFEGSIPDRSLDEQDFDASNPDRSFTASEIDFAVPVANFDFPFDGDGVVPPAPFLQFAAHNELNSEAPDTGYPIRFAQRPEVNTGAGSLTIPLQLCSDIARSVALDGDLPGTVTLAENTTGEAITATLTVLPTTTAEAGIDYDWPGGSAPTEVSIPDGASVSALSLELPQQIGWRSQRILDLELGLPSYGSRGWNWRYRIYFVPHYNDRAPMAVWQPQTVSLGENDTSQEVFLRLWKASASTAYAGEQLLVVVALRGTATYGTHYTTNPPASGPVGSKRLQLQIPYGGLYASVIINPISVDGNETVVLDATTFSALDGQDPVNLFPLGGVGTIELNRIEEDENAVIVGEAATPPTYVEYQDRYPWGGIVDGFGNESNNFYGCNDPINGFRGGTGQLDYERRSNRKDPFTGADADWVMVSQGAYDHSVSEGVSFLHGCVRSSFSAMVSGYYQMDQAGITDAAGVVNDGLPPNASPAQVVLPSSQRMFWSAYVSFQDPSASDAAEDVGLVIYERFGTPLSQWSEDSVFYSAGDRVFFDFNNVDGSQTCRLAGGPSYRNRGLRCLSTHTSACGTAVDPYLDLGANPSVGDTGTYWECISKGVRTASVSHGAVWTPGADPTVDPPTLVDEYDLGEVGSVWTGGTGYSGPHTAVDGSVWWRLWIWLDGEDTDSGATLSTDAYYNVGNYLNLFLQCSTPYDGGTGASAQSQIGRGVYFAGRQFEGRTGSPTEPTTYKERTTFIYEPRRIADAAGPIAYEPSGKSIATVTIIDSGALIADGGDNSTPFVDPTQTVNLVIQVTDDGGSPQNVTDDLDVTLSLDTDGTTEYEGGTTLPPWLGTTLSTATITTGSSSVTVPITINYSAAIQAQLENKSFARLQVSMSIDASNVDGVLMASSEASWIFTVPEDSNFLRAQSDAEQADVVPFP